MAWAAGGAHIVDDSEVVDPGTCQLETWLAGFDGGGGYADATKACTLSSLPRFEFGPQFRHYWNGDMIGSDQFLGPAVKVNLIPQGTGVGLGFTGGVNLATGEFALGSLIVPVSIPLDDRTRINLNAGWQFFPTLEPQNGFF